MSKLKKKKDGPHPQLNLLEDLEEIPRAKGELPRKIIKKKKKTEIENRPGKKKKIDKPDKAAEERRRIIAEPKRDVVLSTTPPSNKSNRKILEKEYKGFQIHISDKEGRDANKTMATIEGNLGSYVFRVFLRLDGQNDVMKTAKVIKLIIDRILPDKKDNKNENKENPNN